MKKKLILSLIIIILFVICAAITVNYEYNLTIADVKDSTINFINIGRDTDVYKLSKSSIWLNTIGIDNKCFALFEITDPLGELLLCEVTLTEGINGKYKIDSVRYGDRNFYERIVESYGKKYFLLGGRNTALLIDSVIVEIDNNKYKLDVPASEQFFVCTAIENKTEQEHILHDKIVFCDINGNDISNHVK